MSASHVPDRSRYRTHTHAEDFVIDWRGYYDQFDQATAELQEVADHERNVSFGDSSYEVMDIYYPANLRESAPIMYFMHGGAMREGHPYHYGFLAKPFIERGIIFITAGYALMPESYFPKNASSAIAGLSWTYDNIAGRGGDPERIYIGGHSAGAEISAYLCVRDDWQEPVGLPIDVITGAMLLSGVYDEGQYDASDQGSQKPNAITSVGPLTRAPQTTVIAFGWPNEPNKANSDNARFGETGYALAEKLEAVGGSVTVLPLEHHDHAQVCAALADDKSVVFGAVENMMNSEHREART
ncbi:MAG: alpha/beta hydrolase [Actinomycetota bacterium]